MGHPCGFLDFVECGVRLADTDVVFDAVVEENRFLGNQCDLTA
jgi:hypothetical protein